MRQVLLVLMALVGLMGPAGHAQAQAPTRQFDHLSTGFPLAGAHANERCDSCHLNGVFKGTPRDCATCHTAGTRFSRANVVKSAQHMPTQVTCENCHDAKTFAGARFSHAQVAAGTCTTCHNGAAAVGKPVQHVATTASCDSCHRSSAWLPAKGMDHSSFNAATNCSSCHNGGSATGKAASHIPTTLNCTSCHTTAGWKPSQWNHTQQVVTAQCASCHSGAFPPADGKPSNHLNYVGVVGIGNASCDSCHKAGFTAWAPAKLHSSFSVSTGCASCHAAIKPATAVHANASTCESCHKGTSSWASAKVDHSRFTAATNCTTCHNGSAGTAKPATHMPTTLNCTSCHSTAGWKPSSWNHSQQVVTAQCANCHSGAFPPADAKPANHINYVGVSGIGNASCDSCHKAGFTAWTPAKLHSSFSVSTGCASCHAAIKPATAVHANASTCESCHKGTSSWASAKVDHSRFTAATNCTTCHNGSAGTAKPATHMPTTLNCSSCHSTAGWKPSSWNHSQQVVTAQCANCHSGAFPPADAKPANHINYVGVSGIGNASCDSCHKGSTTTWSNGRLHANFSVSASCATCHSGAALGATGKPATAIHAGVTACETCHKSSSTWAGAKVDHAGFSAATTCTTCHNGGTATGKAAAHMPTTLNCVACHATSGWKPSKWNHSQQVVTAQCATCHSGAYPPADGKPANHVPYQLLSGAAITNCDSCHKSGTTAWTGARVHANVSISAQCRTCHTGAYPGATSAPVNATHAGIGSTGCESCHKGTSSWAGASFAHSAANAVGSGSCDGCHNGSAAKGKPANHIPVAQATAKCDSCHRSQASFATAVTMSHSAVSGASCKTCHNGAYTSAGTQGALAKPANHIPESQLLAGTAMDCNTCHTSTTSFGTVRMNHNASQGSGSGWCKACHQSGTAFLGGMEKKTLAHEAKGSTPTDCSQSGCHRPLGNKGAAYTKWD